MFFYALLDENHVTWGLLAPKPLGVFRYRLLRAIPGSELHFYVELAIDIVVETDKYVYIIELKRDQSPEIALRQIEEKGYAKPFLASGRKIIKLGINFSSETCTVDGWKMAE